MFIIFLLCTVTFNARTSNHRILHLKGTASDLAHLFPPKCSLECCSYWIF